MQQEETQQAKIEKRTESLAIVGWRRIARFIFRLFFKRREFGLLGVQLKQISHLKAWDPPSITRREQEAMAAALERLPLE